MKLTQYEINGLLKAWQAMSSQQLSPVTYARSEAILRTLHDHNPAAVRQWLIRGGDLGAQFRATSHSTESRAKVLITEEAGADPLDQTIAAPFYIDDLPEDNAPPPPLAEDPPALPLRATPPPEPDWHAERLAVQQRDAVVVDRGDNASLFQSNLDSTLDSVITFPTWRKIGAVLFAGVTFVTQTLLLIALLSTVYAWQTGAALKPELLQTLALACAAGVLMWVWLRTAKRFNTINTQRGLPLTARRATALCVVALAVCGGLTALNEFGGSLLGVGAAVYPTITALVLGLIWNTVFFHGVPILKESDPYGRV